MVIVVAGYQVRPRALLARMIYRWHWKMILLLLALIGVLGTRTGLIPPVWRGGATIHLAAPAAAQVQLNGVAWPTRVYAGTQTVQAVLPDGRTSWATFDLAANTAITVTLPAGLAAPKEQVLPAAAPGSVVDQVYYADGAWRVHSQPVPQPTPERNTGQPTPTPGAGQTLAVRSAVTERLPTLDAYGGLADQVLVSTTHHEAVFRPNNATYNTSIVGSVEVRGWAKPATVPFSNPVTLLQFAPNGQSLLISEQVRDGGEQLSLLLPDGSLTATVAVPGHVRRLYWRADATAVIIASELNQQLTMTMLRLAPTVAAAVLLETPTTPGALIPMTWDTDGLRWIAPDTDGTSALWHAPLASLIPERVQAMSAAAVTVLPTGEVRSVRIVQGQVVIGRMDGSVWIGEVRLSQVPATADLVGLWHDTSLLLMNRTQAWVVTIVEDAH